MKEVIEIIEHANNAFAELENAEKIISETLPKSYAGALLEEKQAVEKKEAVNGYRKEFDTVQSLLDAVAEKISTAKAEQIESATESKDVQLLQLPIDFTADELKEMAERNRDNSFILRAIQTKAEKQGMKDLTYSFSFPPDLNNAEKDIRERVARIMPDCDKWETCAEYLKNHGLTRALVEYNLQKYVEMEV